MIELLSKMAPYLIFALAWVLRIEMKLGGMHRDIQWIIKLLNSTHTGGGTHNNGS